MRIRNPTHPRIWLEDIAGTGSAQDGKIRPDTRGHESAGLTLPPGTSLFAGAAVDLEVSKRKLPR